jgi:hypothetical protein
VYLPRPVMNRMSSTRLTACPTPNFIGFIDNTLEESGKLRGVAAPTASLAL